MKKFAALAAMALTILACGCSSVPGAIIYLPTKVDPKLCVACDAVLECNKCWNKHPTLAPCSDPPLVPEPCPNCHKVHLFTEKCDYKGIAICPSPTGPNGFPLCSHCGKEHEMIDCLQGKIRNPHCPHCPKAKDYK